MFLRASGDEAWQETGDSRCPLILTMFTNIDFSLQSLSQPHHVSAQVTDHTLHISELQILFLCRQLSTAWHLPVKHSCLCWILVVKKTDFHWEFSDFMFNKLFRLTDVVLRLGWEMVLGCHTGQLIQAKSQIVRLWGKRLESREFCQNSSLCKQDWQTPVTLTESYERTSLRYIK